ncbi:glycosyltransferase family 2 protein [Jatrophihabitans telluris]|uniref:4,4'-diaponeurosporenoate glycosyltransferase n=1 Tax=Jatrophihabitans telluris TaxID=2038343 RepID=A0ABY4QZ31_9ACTN|nr:glycosyltransferase family A protein [Jatrophihabitans telluris]UQX88834.1 glycosyltransferase family 2 protein [Jatrophihabitans telluris]
MTRTEPRSQRYIGVVVPAHNEEDHLGPCLTSILVAAESARSMGYRVEVVVVLDRCTDRTAARVPTSAGWPRIRVLSCRQGGVGAARDDGMRSLIRRYPTDRLWLASTDADSLVPVDWLTAQLTHHANGAEVVAGTVQVRDWSEHQPDVVDRYLLGYRHEPGHGHVHGANLGLSANAYLRAGGFPRVTEHEDVGLIATVSRLNLPMVWVADLPVITSARRHNRAPGGFAGHLRALAAEVADVG